MRRESPRSIPPNVSRAHVRAAKAIVMHAQQATIALNSRDFLEMEPRVSNSGASPYAFTGIASLAQQEPNQSVLLVKTDHLAVT